MKTIENREFRSFGRGAAGRSLLVEPRSVDDVRNAFESAYMNHVRVAVRGGGHSFHDQALHSGDNGEQMILSTRYFDSIEFAPNGDALTVRIGAGVKWIDYYNAAVPRASLTGEPLRLPGSLQTGRNATAGGTMSGDCLSRFSGILGKESQWIESFRIVTTDGD